MLPLCMQHHTTVTVNSDAHDPYFVGEVSAAWALLEQMDFDQSLILNNDLDKLKSFELVCVANVWMFIDHCFYFLLHAYPH
jgi:hypothetical protein